MDAQELIEQMRGRVTPKQRTDVPEHFVSLLNSLLDAAKIGAEAMLGGSYAKDTYLEGDHDIDVFVRFEEKYKDEEMPDLLSLAISGLGGVRRVHGSRDYFQLEKDGFSFEVVPVLKIARAEEARNVTDISPLHVAHVKQAIAKRPVLAGDIRLAKLFCKAAKVYGAESYINGFSGHVLDTLVLHYGGFQALVEAASSWGEHEFIDPAGERGDAGFLNPAKRQSPLILLDPLQPERNAAAALSKERYDRFRHAAKGFLARPDESYFTPIPFTKEEVTERHPGKPALCYALTPLQGSKDVVGTKLLKAHQHLIKRARAEGFSIIDEAFEFSGDEAFAAVIVEQEPLPATMEREGPPVSVRKDVDRFREAHGSAVEERDGRLYASLPRAHTTLASLFSSLVNGKYWSGRVAKAKIL
ncbi:nucleotidyltransferase domain-containing protein [Candidatus Woesearchaeota archaeon]|nr:nucleotidyltransferase domain-containing protein [Candidatus Woesearchaeota archaeon]